MVYVTEVVNDCVSMFKDGTYVDSFGSKGEGEKDFNCPTDIAISGDKIYIADTDNNRVKVLSPS